MVVSRFWRKIPQLYNLIGAKCDDCGHLMFPPRDVCFKCRSKKVSDHQFEGKGKIVTYTIIRTPFSDPECEVKDIPGYDSPYPLAIVELSEGPRLTTQIVDCSPEDVSIGSEVEMVFRKIQEHGDQGVIQYGYKFKLI